MASDSRRTEQNGRSPDLAYLVQTPLLLPGVTCYTDASTTPDSSSNTATDAGLGVLIINNHIRPAQNFYIEALFLGSTTVLMAEAAALALAAIIIQSLNLQGVKFLSDNEQLVLFLNDPDQSNPLDWRIKHFTQQFSNCAAQTGATIFKIDRINNQTADTLAKQALSVGPSTFSLDCICSNTAHVPQYPFIEALSSVTLNSVRLLTPSCC